MAEIFRDLSSLKKVLERERSEGKKVVLANGAFDILHVGHIRYLRGAKEKGDILVVAVNSDESVRKLKGPGRPIVPLEERMEILSSLKFVDYIIPFSEITVDNIIKELKPDVHAKGTDYTKESVPEAETSRSLGVNIEIVGDPKNHSSTEVSKAFWETAFGDGIDLLKKLISINTSNPPGATREAVLLLKNFLENEGIQAKVLKASDEKWNLISFYEGSKDTSPVVLLSHLDVVPADPSSWDSDPFSPTEKDGYLVGRGALDMKGMLVVFLMGVVSMARLGIKGERPVAFVATCDEEVGGEKGALLVVEKEETVRGAHLVMNEGGSILKDDSGRVLRYEVATDQKIICQYKLIFSGTSSHSSLPPLDSAPKKMIQAALRIIEKGAEPKYLPSVREYLEKVHGVKLKDGEELPESLFPDPFLRSITRNTEEFTVFEGGDKANVIPGRVSVTVDARLLPGENPEEYLKGIEELLDPYGVKIERIHVGKPVQPTVDDVGFFKSLEKVKEAFHPGVPIVPMLLPGATDSRHLREMGIRCFDFVPVGVKKSDLLTIHSSNERIEIKELKLGIRIMFELLKELTRVEVLL